MQGQGAFYNPALGFVQETDNSAEIESLRRRQALQQALQSQLMAQPIVAGSSRQALIQALSKVGQSLIAQRTETRAAEKEKELRAGDEAVRQQNLGAYMDLRNGRPGETLSDASAQALLGGDVNPNLVEPIKANPKEAILRAMLSRDPRLQALGAMDAQAAQKTAGFKDHVIDKTLVRTPNDGSAPQVLGSYNSEKWSEPYTVQGPSGPLLVIRNAGTGEVKPVDRSPKVSVATNVDTKGQLAAAEALGKKAPEVLAGAQESFLKSQQALEDGKQLLALTQSPDLISGFAAEPLTALASLGAKLGFTGPEAAAQTQATLSALANNTLAQVKRLPGAITEKERPFLEMAASGKQNWTPETLQQLAALSIASAHNDMIQAYKQYQGAADIPGAEQGRAMYPIPALNHTLDEGMFQDIGGGRVRYKGQLPGMSQSRGQSSSPGASKPSKPPALQVYNW